MQNSLLDQGLTLMLAGMGTVFVFLTLLVVAMTLMARIVRRLQPVPSAASDEEVAAISAAIALHRKK
jgi:oxaloacetate decarboxylase gamma subunit